MRSVTKLILAGILGAALITSTGSFAVNYTAIQDKKNYAKEKDLQGKNDHSQRICTEEDRKNMKAYNRQIEKFQNKSEDVLKNLAEIQNETSKVNSPFIKVYKDMTEYAASEEFEKSRESFDICGVSPPDISEPPFWMQ